MVLVNDNTNIILEIMTLTMSVLLYGFETWTVNTDLKWQIDAFLN